MSKAKKAKPAKKPKPPRAPKKPSRLAVWWDEMDPSRRARVRKSLTVGTLAVLLAVALGVGAKLLESKVLAGMPAPAVRQVRFTPRSFPNWMSRTLSEGIGHAVYPPNVPFHDPDFAEALSERAQASPWIAKVHSVSRQYDQEADEGVLDLDVVYRRPFARVMLADNVTLAWVDRHGCRLPEPPEMAHRHFVIVQGVAERPPAIGQPWQGQDLADALTVIEWMLTRTYGQQITGVDVRNHAGLDPYLARIRLFAQQGRGRATEIRFGRLPVAGAGDYVRSIEDRVTDLDKYVRDNGGRLAGVNRWIDVQNDQLLLSVD